MGIKQVELRQIANLKVENFEQAVKLRDEFIWRQLDQTTVQEAVFHWLATISLKTAATYLSGMRRIFDLKLLDLSMSLQAFALVNHDTIIDCIKLISDWTEFTRQA